MRKDGGFWIFGYGSLMWRPGFEIDQARLARLDDYRRAFTLVSVHYRGTPERPGLVLGLDWKPGHSCTGMALRVAPDHADEVRQYVADRELVSRAYFEVSHRVTLLSSGEFGAPPAGEEVDAICYVVDRTHPQYAGNLSLAEQAAIIDTAEGPSGTNRDYLFNTAAHLRELGIDDPDLFALEAMLRGR